MKNLVIILVEPQMGENIGAAARVMHNFSLSDLRIVSPRDGWPNEKADSMSAGGIEIIKNAKIFNNVKDAIADLNYVAAVTARERDMEKPSYLSKEISHVFEDRGKVALMFGGERSGLSNGDVAFANSIVTIATNPEYPSLNLAQAVAVLVYELNGDGSGWTGDCDNGLVEGKNVTNLVEYLEQELDVRGFFDKADKKGKVKNNLRNIFTSNNYTEQEINILRGAIKTLAEG